MGLKNKLLQLSFIKAWRKNRLKRKFPGSADYWEHRYAGGGNSGTGSYDQLAAFKADFLNTFVGNNNIKDVLEFGCGDGNQLSLAKYPRYCGLDVSTSIIQSCMKRFEHDKTKSFFLHNTLAFADNAGIFKAELTLSLDVLFHLTEKEVFEKYLQHLFAASTRFVIIYATDFDQEEEPFYPHENRRNFSRFVSDNMKDWSLKETIQNKYPVEKYGNIGSDCSFYVYQKLS